MFGDSLISICLVVCQIIHYIQLTITSCLEMKVQEQRSYRLF